MITQYNLWWKYILLHIYKTLHFLVFILKTHKLNKECSKTFFLIQREVKGKCWNNCCLLFSLALKSSLVWNGSQRSFSMFPPARKMVVNTPMSIQEKMKLNPTPLWTKTNSGGNFWFMFTMLTVNIFILQLLWRISNVFSPA